MVKISRAPVTDAFRGQLDLDHRGFVITDREALQTSRAGVLRGRRRGQPGPTGGWPPPVRASSAPGTIRSLLAMSGAGHGQPGLPPDFAGAVRWRPRGPGWTRRYGATRDRCQPADPGLTPLVGAARAPTLAMGPGGRPRATRCQRLRGRRAPSGPSTGRPRPPPRLFRTSTPPSRPGWTNRPRRRRHREPRGWSWTGSRTCHPASPDLAVWRGRTRRGDRGPVAESGPATIGLLCRRARTSCRLRSRARRWCPTNN